MMSSLIVTDIIILMMTVVVELKIMVWFMTAS